MQRNRRILPLGLGILTTVFQLNAVIAIPPRTGSNGRGHWGILGGKYVRGSAAILSRLLDIMPPCNGASCDAFVMSPAFFAQQLQAHGLPALAARTSPTIRFNRFKFHCRISCRTSSST